MKTKAKLILAMSVLTAGVVAAGATGTFAWFTTNRAAQLHYNSVTAQKNAGNLDVYLGNSTSESGFGDGTKAYVHTGETIASHTINSSAAVSDVSSANGYDFCKPIWKTVSGNNQDATMFEEGDWGVDYTTFWFSVSNTGNNPLDVYLNSGTAITAAPVEGVNEEQTAKNTAAAKFTRVSIAATTEDTTPGKPKALSSAPAKNWLLENTSGAYDQKYFAPTNYANPQKVIPTALPSGVTSFVLDSGVEATAMEAVTTTGSADQKLCTLPGKTTETAPVQYFIVSIWLEGVKEGDTAFDTAVGGKVNITLDLAGVEAVGA